MFFDIIRRFFYRIIWKISKPNNSDYIKYIGSIGIKIYPKVASIDETIEELRTKNKSIARYGDGEFMLCFGRSINFQKNDYLLRKRLRAILKNNRPTCLIGLPSYNPQLFSSFWQQFWYENTKIVANLLNRNTKYYNQEISRGANLDQIDKLKTIWERRNVIFVYGKGSRFDVNHELFKEINEKHSIEGLAINAWSEYESLFQKVLSLSKTISNPIVLCALGPTATVLAFDLSVEVQTIDLGHLTNVFDVLRYNTISPEKLPEIIKE